MKRIEPNIKSQPSTHANGILVGSDLHVSGQVGIAESSENVVVGIANQAAMALKNFQAVVESANGSKRDIVKLTIYIADITEFYSSADEFIEVFSDFFDTGHVPAMTMVGVAALMSPEYLVEIEGFAKIGASAA